MYTFTAFVNKWKTRISSAIKNLSVLVLLISHPNLIST